MKRIFLIIVIGLIHMSSFGQAREIYVNDDLINISKAEFDEKTDEQLYFDIRLESDTLIINVKVDRFKKGRITKTQHDAIRRELSAARHQKIDEQTIVVINYYPGLDRCNSTGLSHYRKESYERYIKKIKRFKNVNQFFVYKSPEGTREYGEKLKWYKDNSAIIENIFFPIHYPCGSYVLIDSKGNYYAQKGEHSTSTIISLLKDEEATFGN